jgi:hypothetical protein
LFVSLSLSGGDTYTDSLSFKWFEDNLKVFSDCKSMCIKDRNNWNDIVKHASSLKLNWLILNIQESTTLDLSEFPCLSTLELHNAIRNTVTKLPSSLKEINIVFDTTKRENPEDATIKSSDLRKVISVIRDNPKIKLERLALYLIGNRFDFTVPKIRTKQFSVYSSNPEYIDISFENVECENFQLDIRGFLLKTYKLIQLIPKVTKYIRIFLPYNQELMEDILIILYPYKNVYLITVEDFDQTYLDLNVWK